MDPLGINAISLSLGCIPVSPHVTSEQLRQAVEILTRNEPKPYVSSELSLTECDRAFLAGLKVAP